MSVGAGAPRRPIGHQPRRRHRDGALARRIVSMATPSASVTGSPVSAGRSTSSRCAISEPARTHSSQPAGAYTPELDVGRQPGRGTPVEPAQIDPVRVCRAVHS